MTRSWLFAPMTTAVVGALCAIPAGVAEGGRGVLSALLGTAVVLAFFWTGIVPILLARDETSKGLATGVLLLTYTLRLAVAVAVLRVAGRSDALSQRWVGLTVIGCALAWTVAQVVRGLRTPDPV